ncbi:hypothetical protein D3C76_776170 [compost metagenome]
MRARTGRSSSCRRSCSTDADGRGHGPLLRIARPCRSNCLVIGARLPLTLTLSPGRGDRSELPAGTAFIPTPWCPLSLWSGARSQGWGEGIRGSGPSVETGHARDNGCMPSSPSPAPATGWPGHGDCDAMPNPTLPRAAIADREAKPPAQPAAATAADPADPRLRLRRLPDQHRRRHPRADRERRAPAGTARPRRGKRDQPLHLPAQPAGAGNQRHPPAARPDALPPRPGQRLPRRPQPAQRQPRHLPARHLRPGGRHQQLAGRRQLPRRGPVVPRLLPGRHAGQAGALLRHRQHHRRARLLPGPWPGARRTHSRRGGGQGAPRRHRAALGEGPPASLRQRRERHHHPLQRSRPAPESGAPAQRRRQGAPGAQHAVLLVGAGRVAAADPRGAGRQRRDPDLPGGGEGRPATHQLPVADAQAGRHAVEVHAIHPARRAAPGSHDPRHPRCRRLRPAGLPADRLERTAQGARHPPRRP